MADLHEINPKEFIDSSFTNSPSTFESLASGALGGISLVLVGHPLDLLKVRLQTDYSTPSMSKLLRSLLKTEGMAGIYRGVTAPLIGVAPIFAISIWGFDTGKRLAGLYLSRDLTDPLVVALGGAFSAIPTSLLQVPGDRIKLRLQVSDARKHANPFQETRKIWMEGNGNYYSGIRSLYKGYFITLAREIPGSAIYFSNYHYMRNLITFKLRDKDINEDTITAMSILIAGGTAGTLNGILTLPIDTIKSRFQSSILNEYSSARQVAIELLRKEGSSALFRGLGPVIIRAFPANAACFSGIELIRYLCK